MRILSPPNLRYPVTVTRLEHARDAKVEDGSTLFHYTYETWVEEAIDRSGNTKKVKHTFPAKFESPNEGTIQKWFITPGTVIQKPGVDIVEIVEQCGHHLQYGGLCAGCGKDMTLVNYNTDERNSARATISMEHNNTSLLVSEEEAGRADRESKERLLKAKKLSLIVDLDQTVIHTTCEKTVAEWQSDPTNPNYEAVKDVKSFQLADDNVAGVAANWYYVKMRPGLKGFFDRMAEKYEMHVYTMATRAYAQAVCKIIDPDRRYFGDRILSRDENYTDKLKSLHRLFPTNTDMVVIIDDRADIWHYSDNLVRVPVFNFFPGAGDINASFLPKQQDLLMAAAKGTKVEPGSASGEQDAQTGSDMPVSVAGQSNDSDPVATGDGTLTDLEQQLISMGAQDNPTVLEEQVKEQEKIIIEQQTERPLLQKQLLLDEEDEKAEAEEATNDDSTHAQNGASDHHPRHRHSLLHNDDRGLEIVEKNLNAVHKAFYDEYRSNRKVPAGGRVAALQGTPKKRIQEFVPDIKILMPRIKEAVLDGVFVCFSGIIPLGMDVQTSDLALWIKSFGAIVVLDVNRHTTHVIANPDRKTSKVKKAARYPRIKIVNIDWMLHCCTQWVHADETPYLIEIDEADRAGSPFDDPEDSDMGPPDKGNNGENDAEITEETWQDMDAELEEFLNEPETEEEGDSEAESVRSDSTAQTDSKPIKRKRKRDSEIADESGTESDASVTSTSKLQMRKKRTIERVSSLTNVVSADKSSGLPSPETTGPEEEAGDNDGPVVEPVGIDIEDNDYDDELEAELLAEFEKNDSDVEDK